MLKLDDNSLGAAGAHYLAGLLEKPSCLLRELHLFCNVIKYYLTVYTSFFDVESLDIQVLFCMLIIIINDVRSPF